MTLDNSKAGQDGPRDLVTGEILGDRVCSACGFNLHGQHIVREAHYGMLIVRCPECSTVAAMEEYPSLGKWARRLSVASAVLVIAGALVLFAFSVALLSGVVKQISWRIDEACATKIARAHLAYQQSKSPTAGQSGALVPGMAAVTFNGYAYDQIELQWWSQQDEQAFKEKGGILWRPFDLTLGREIVLVALAGVSVGIAWSVVLCGVSRWRVLLLGFVLAGSTLVSVWLGGLDDPLRGWGTMPNYSVALQLASQSVTNEPQWKTLTAAMIFVMAGLVIGRPTARRIVRWLLPPRYVGLLGILWTCDHLPVPSAKAQPRARVAVN